MLLVIPALVGGVAVPLVNLAKDAFGWTKPRDKVKNLWLSVAVSVVVSAFALFVTRSFVPYSGDPATVVGWLTTTFAVATLVYKSMAKQSEANPNPEALG